MKSNATLTDSDSVRAIGFATVATREPSLKKSRPYGRVSTIASGPSESFLNLTRKPSLEPPARFEPTAKSPNDIVI